MRVYLAGTFGSHYLVFYYPLSVVLSKDAYHTKCGCGLHNVVCVSAPCVIYTDIHPYMLLTVYILSTFIKVDKS